MSAAVPAPARYVLWAVGLLGDLLAPTLAARRKGVPMHMEHLPERFGLFIILVLGESVAAVITGLHDGHWSPQVVLAAALAFTVAAALWWLYFDFSGGAAKRRLLEEGDDSRTGVHDVYVYAHLPIAVGLAAVAVGLEQAVVHAGDPALSAPARWTLAGGLALYLASTALLQAWMAGRLRASLPWPLVGVPAVLLLAAVVEQAPQLLASLALVLVVGLRSALAQNRAGWVRTAPV